VSLALVLSDDQAVRWAEVRSICTARSDERGNGGVVPCPLERGQQEVEAGLLERRHVAVQRRQLVGELLRHGDDARPHPAREHDCIFDRAVSSGHGGRTPLLLLNPRRGKRGDVSRVAPLAASVLTCERDRSA